MLNKKTMKNLAKLRKRYGELFPSHVKDHYSIFCKDLMRRACLEYWQNHDFTWYEYTPPTLSFTPTVLSIDLLSDHPGDRASALSTRAFEELYRINLSYPEKSDAGPRTTMNQFCVAVCCMGKVMLYISREPFGQKLSAKHLLALALIVTECENPERTFLV